MVNASDEYLARRRLHLRMTAEAHIVVRLREHCAVDRAVRAVAGGAALAQRRMLKHKGSRLLAVALGAIFVEPRHCQAAGWLEDVAAMWIVALRAVHVAFEDGMMCRQLKFRAHRQMTAQTRLRLDAGIDDKLAPAAGFHMLAARPVARFAANAAGDGGVFQGQMRVRTGGKLACDVGVAIVADLVAHIVCARNFQRRHHRARHGATRNQKDARHSGKPCGNHCHQCSLEFHPKSDAA